MINGVISFLVNYCIAQIFLGLFGGLILFPAPVTREVLSALGIAASENNILATWAAGILVLAAVLALVPAFQKFLAWFYGWRTPRPEELARIQAALDPVYANSPYKPGDFILKVEDNSGINAAAFGHRIIVVNTGTLLLPVEEISGILAHEAGHITHKDSRYLIVAYAMDLVGQFMVKCIMWVHNTCAFLARCRIPAVSSFLAFLTWFFLALEIIIDVALSLPRFFASQFLSRRCEYAADRYACEIGLGRELYASLYRISQGEAGMSWWDRIRSDHPVTGSRLARIQAYLEAHPEK